MILYARYFRRSYFGYAVFAKSSPFDFARPSVLGLSLVVEISLFWFRRSAQGLCLFFARLYVLREHWPSSRYVCDLDLVAPLALLQGVHSNLLNSAFCEEVYVDVRLLVEQYFLRLVCRFWRISILLLRSLLDLLPV